MLIVLGLALLDSNRASKSLSDAAVLERSLFTTPGRDDLKASACSCCCCRVFGDVGAAEDAPDLLLSGVPDSLEELGVDNCDTGVSASVSFRLGRRAMFLGGEEVTISTSSAKRTVESVRLRDAASGG